MSNAIQRTNQLGTTEGKQRKNDKDSGFNSYCKIDTMNLKAHAFRLSAYGAVGFLCAGVYAVILIILEQWLPVWLANPGAFLVASLVGSLGHSRYTFRRETRGDSFAKRWVTAQYLINVTVCTLLPLVLPSFLDEGIRLLILVFTPTLLNAFIWSQAARFSENKQIIRTQPLLHADDLGLSNETNYAICQLTNEGKLNGASLLVQAPATQEAVRLWSQIEQKYPDINLCLHLCLTEGPPSANTSSVKNLINGKGFLHYSFGKWLLLSLMPNNLNFKKKIRRQLSQEIKAQIKLFKILTKKNDIQLDGHQHIHLVPIVIEEIVRVANTENIKWIRSTREPLPSGLPIRYWWHAFRDAGLLKWLVLQILSIMAESKLKRNNISTNQLLSGILFTGQMTILPLKTCWQALSCHQVSKNNTSSILLAHPSSTPKINLSEEGFSISHPFAKSEYRQLEWQGLETLSEEWIN